MIAMRKDLLQAILDDPEALEPRLVMADWLMEHGESAGRFHLVAMRPPGLSEPQAASRADRPCG